MTAKKIRNKSNLQKSRKELRKEKRKSKKIRRNEYYTSKRKPGQFVLVNSKHREGSSKQVQKEKETTNSKNKLGSEEIRNREKKQQMKLQKEMNKRRCRQLMEANLEEDRTLKRLEKQLKLNKRKSKTVPTSFTRDGLDYLLEVCDPENLENSALAEQQLIEVNNEFDEDLVLMTESGAFNLHEENSLDIDDNLDNSSKIDSNKNNVTLKTKKRKNSTSRNDPKKSKKDLSSLNKGWSSCDHLDECDDEIENATINSHESDGSDNDTRYHGDNSENDGTDSDSADDVDTDNETEKFEKSKKTNGTWEDIYGRLRTKDGSVINLNDQKYIPPAARMKLEEYSTDKARNQKLERLRKQLKGLTNRLAESNMHNISTQIEELYMNNSRNDMNNTITNLIMDALVSNILAPERLLMEHIMLITILHANIGTEVGAHFLQTIVKQFDKWLKSTDTESKRIDNIVIILAQLYNFKLFDSKLVYEVLDILAEKFHEKHVECILHILRNVGFNLRKDNPIALKNLIVNLQKQASDVSKEELKNNSRVKFMLDVLLAIKNNNVTKIPNYDTSYSEHLKKIMKGFIRKGNYVTLLNISLDDLLKAEEKGKWWVVGSAWTGNSAEMNHSENSKQQAKTFSRKLLTLAAKQRMNTDTRKNIFCIIMSAEDYLDAFEKLLRLTLKNQQEREIIHVILHCCLQEKTYNPYYATLAQKFCEHDRKYQMTIKYSIWDKIKALEDHSGTQISHLAKLLSFLFIEKGLPISTLKVVHFSELDKTTLRFIRQILLGILLHEDLDVCKGVFEKVSHSGKLKLFRESLRLFIYHFLLRNIETQVISNDKKKLLQERVKVVEKLLARKEMKI